MAAKNKGLSNPYVKVNRRKRIGFNFSDKHKRYIKNCVNSTYNILEGAVRSGKTVDNVFAFAHELKTTKDTAMRSICGLSQQKKQVIWSRSSGELKSQKSSRMRF